MQRDFPFLLFTFFVFLAITVCVATPHAIADVPSTETVSLTPPVPPDESSSTLTPDPSSLPSDSSPPTPSDDTALPDTTAEEEDEEEITYDVPIIVNNKVEDYLRYFQTTIRERFGTWLYRSGRYLPLMREIFREEGLPEDLVFVALIESGFNPYAYSRAKAVGPWQFMKFTGRKYGLRVDNYIDERRDPIKSTHAAARYLKDLYALFGSWPLALASYNAGEGKILRALTKSKAGDYWDLQSSRYLRRETKGYVPKFMAATIIAKNPEKYGFPPESSGPLRYEEVPLERQTHLRLIAKAAGVPYEELKALNPELRKEMTPPNYKDYIIKLPYGMKQAFIENFSKLPATETYIVRKGDNLALIAKRFGTTVQSLQEQNSLGKKTLLRAGAILTVPYLPEAPAPHVVAENVKKQIIYRVKRGDTLWDIAKNFNVRISEIRRWNDLMDGEHIRPGDRLKLVVRTSEL